MQKQPIDYEEITDKDYTKPWIYPDEPDTEIPNQRWLLLAAAGFFAAIIFGILFLQWWINT